LVTFGFKFSNGVMDTLDSKFSIISLKINYSLIINVVAESRKIRN